MIMILNLLGLVPTEIQLISRGMALKGKTGQQRGRSPEGIFKNKFPQLLAFAFLDFPLPQFFGKNGRVVPVSCGNHDERNVIFRNLKCANCFFDRKPCHLVNIETLVRCFEAEVRHGLAGIVPVIATFVAVV